MMGGARHRVAADAIAAYVEEFALQCDLRDKLAIQKLASNVASLAAENVYQSLRIEWDSGYRVGLHLGSTCVNTEEELNALPAWSVVLSVAYTHHKSGKRISFQRWDDGAWHRGGRAASTHPDNFLPATVLHVGDCA